jgi:hypothetical protein
LVDPAGNLAEPRLERGALGLLIGCKCGKALSEVRLDLSQPAAERGHELLALPLEACGDLGELLLEPHPAGVAELSHTLGKQGLALAGEGLDGALELTGETTRRVFPRGLDRSVELKSRRVDESSRGALEDAFELLDLAALDIRERRVDPARNVRLLALDPAHEVPLPHGQPLGDLVERSAALGGM